MQRYLTRQLQAGVAGLQGGQADLQHKLQSLQDANNSLQESQASLLGRVAALEAALVSFGYTLSPPVLSLLLRKFDRSGRQAVAFDDFIQCCLVLQGVTEAFRAEDVAQSGVVTLSYERFLTLLLNSSLL